MSLVAALHVNGFPVLLADLLASVRRDRTPKDEIPVVPIPTSQDANATSRSIVEGNAADNYFVRGLVRKTIICGGRIAVAFSGNLGAAGMAAGEIEKEEFDIAGTETQDLGKPQLELTATPNDDTEEERHRLSLIASYPIVMRNRDGKVLRWIGSKSMPGHAIRNIDSIKYDFKANQRFNTVVLEDMDIAEVAVVTALIVTVGVGMGWGEAVVISRLKGWVWWSVH